MPTSSLVTRVVYIRDYYREFRYKQLLTDSRKVAIAHDTIFFAIKGQRQDGHNFIRSLYNKGVRWFIIEDEEAVTNNFRNDEEARDARFLLVESSIRTLQALAAHHRSQFKLPVIGITGSNGKTIIKEWLSQLLSDSFQIIKSPKSYNSQIGVPLSVWELSEEHTLAIFEAGISQPGEMEYLEPIIQPNIGIFTNLGSAHDDGFESRIEKATEKALLFENCKFLISRDIYSAVNTAILYLKERKGDPHFFGWTTQDVAIYPSAVDMRYLDPNVGGVNVGLYDPHTDKKLNFYLPFSNPAHVENCLHCIVTMLLFEYKEKEIQERINKLKAVEMRLEYKQGLFNCSLIDDTYNNDFAGLQVALDFLLQQGNKPKRTVILSDMPEEKQEGLYERIFQLCAKKGVERVIAVGDNIKRTLIPDTETLIDVEFFATTEDFLSDFADGDIRFGNEAILIKGARRFEFEKIVEALELKVHGTKLEVNLNNLAHNLDYFRSLISPRTRIMAMVKAFGYGSGTNYEVAHLLQYHRVDYMAVAYVDEGIALRNEGIRTPIMVMNPSVDSFEKMFVHNLEPEIYSISTLKRFVEYAKEKAYELNLAEFGADVKDVFKIHLKLDTGMNRLGFATNDLPLLLDLINSVGESLEVASVFTHLAAADDEGMDDFSFQQIKEFEEWAAELEKQLGYSFLRHAVNSAGIIRFKNSHFEMVRLGLGLYGVDASKKAQEHLLPISSLKATISQIKVVHPEDSVGYSRKGKVERISKIATIAIGYADGYDRRFGNGVGKVYLHGELAPTVGNICMDMCMVDVTDIEDAKEGDEVIIFGEYPTVTELADTIGTIPYEILTNVSERVKRIFYAD